MRNGTVGVALLGCGSMGRSLGMQMLHVDEARLLGVADVSREAATRAADELGVPASSTVEELLAHPDVDAVLIAAPPFEHRPLAELAAARGKHLFVEKPLAPSTADCDAILRSASAAGVTLMVGQVLRYYPCWWHILEMVRDGEIGKPYGISISRAGRIWSGGFAQQWRYARALSGGTLMEVNAHEIDFMCEVCGDVERVYAEAGHYGEDPCDFPNLCYVSLRFTGGAVGMLHSSMVSALPDISGKVEGSEGSVHYTQGFSPDGVIRHARHGEPVQSLRVGDIDEEQPVRRELRLFIDAVRGGASPIPGADGRRNVAIAEAAYESARTGLPVTL